MLADLRYAFRQLWKEPRFTIVAVLALAIGIGANTAIFSVVNAVLLKPLPFPQPNKLMAVGSIDNRASQTGDGDLNSMSYPDFFDFRSQNKSFENLALYRSESLTLTNEGAAESLRAQKVTGNFFDVLGIPPLFGRTFQRAEEKPGGGPNGYTAVLSHSFWQARFKSDPQVIGRSITFDGRPHTIVGVMPARFRFPIDSEAVDLFVTIARDANSIDGSKPETEQRGSHSLQGVGRLKPGVTSAQADAELTALAGALAQKYPESNTHFGARAVSLREYLVGDIARGLYVLFSAVACVLLIASANVANLLLARATVRQKEIALRAALGASRRRVVRQLLTESLLLAGLGGLGGLILAAWGTDWLVSLVPESIPRAETIHLDGWVLAFTVLASLGTGILFGLAPAWQTSRLDLRTALNENARGSTGRHRLRSALVVTEVALALLLLTGAGLLLQSFARLSQVNPGLQPDHLLTAAISLSDAAYPKPENSARFQEQLLARIRALPGVRGASTVLPLPLSGSNMTTSFDLEERPKPEGQQDAAPVRVAGDNYIQTMGVPLLRGRLFDPQIDRFDGRQVMIINERFAQKYFPGEDPLGKRMRPGFSLTDKDGPMREIVGIVGNVKHQSLRTDFTPEMYIPSSQFPLNTFSLVVRTATSQPEGSTAALRDAVAQIDPGVPLRRVGPYAEYLGLALARPRFNALLLSIFAGVALLLTAIGIYGVMAYSVAQRRQEIGIRMALGAQKSDVLRLIVGGGMQLAALGVVVGLLGAYALTRLLGSLLYGVGSFDGVTLGAVALLLAAIALLACWFPARRAAAVHPLTALREP
ncbi:MAG TPA: ABC transporter permease [Chthoniobacterales bacterium]|nr:ABC transporter permease [Chthoniobacterales bacterium]